MPLNSMTGFARLDGSAAGNRFAWELRAVNGRGLDLRLRLPPGFDAVEAAVRRKASEALSRGNVSINLTVTRETSTQTFRIDEALLSTLIDTARRLSGTPGIRDASLDGLLAVRGVVEVVEAAPDEESAKVFEAELVSTFGKVLADFQASRAAEGVALSRILGDQVDEIARLVAEAEALPARTPEAIRDRLEEQLAVLLAREDIDPQRLHVEAALIATRADVREEIDRLKAHIAQARELMASDAAVGRRLDFLAQEFNRESNTLCSKSNDTALTRIGLALKAVVDQFKEQVQNVE
ncbi:YicC/YloC family endoribonuclease [Pleomorphomonas sp. NRK KF1]|uniref:YicC/YloC family endoribonuclease n=1 Tax=Pleomorphomonas sp. NRK KF1 TaxID=2943000 RepID=UPI00204485B3|nr:YicC/YloC family endoribonuclease [Pleomorphomonas sp. NRK KF1]MCM5551623.1 YicC family protein [Pleomorphomonas sp. NRK KF1]